MQAIPLLAQRSWGGSALSDNFRVTVALDVFMVHNEVQCTSEQGLSHPTGSPQEGM